MTDADNLYRLHRDAQKYIAKIGAVQPHYHDGSVGTLNALSVQTKICHQRDVGATNYWTDQRFDWALSEVVKKHFSELAEEALEYMKQKADEALIAEKKELQERLARIEALEKEMGA